VDVLTVERPMANIEGSPKSSSRTMKMLVIVFAVWVAYWAATGGIDRIPVSTSSTATPTVIQI